MRKMECGMQGVESLSILGANRARESFVPHAVCGRPSIKQEWRFFDHDHDLERRLSFPLDLKRLTRAARGGIPVHGRAALVFRRLASVPGYQDRADLSPACLGRSRGSP